MSEMNYKNEELRRVLHQLSAEIPAAAALLENDSLITELETIGGHDSDACMRTLELCADVMERRPADMGQWLSDLCDRLSNNMFPDADHPRCDLTGEEKLYLAVLEQVFERFCVGK